MWRRLSMLPVERSSSTNTSSPRSRYASARCDPMNPAPPVMSTRISPRPREVPFTLTWLEARPDSPAHDRRRSLATASMIDWIIEDCRPGVAGLISATGAISSPDEGDESLAHASGTVGVAVQLTAKCSLSRHARMTSTAIRMGTRASPCHAPAAGERPGRRRSRPRTSGDAHNDRDRS